MAAVKRRKVAVKAAAATAKKRKVVVKAATAKKRVVRSKVVAAAARKIRKVVRASKAVATAAAAKKRRISRKIAVKVRKVVAAIAIEELSQPQEKIAITAAATKKAKKSRKISAAKTTTTATTTTAAKTKAEKIAAKIGEFVAASENPYLPQKSEVLEFFRESPDNFTLTVNFKSNHKPGQFVMVSLPGIGEAPISISSYSTDFMKLNIRQVGSVTNAAAKLRKGDSIFIRGPYGRGYPMDVLEGNNIVMIGGGCGVAPLKGIIEYVAKNRQKFRNIDLFFGYRSVHDVLFSRELPDWKKSYNTLISIDKTGEGETCGPDMKVGFITEQVKNAGISSTNCVAFLCGPPKMMELVIGILKDRGFHSDQIFVSAERLMQCAVGKCGHCMIRGKYTCLDGPVFRWDELEDSKND